MPAETRHTVNIDPVRSKIVTGPANLLIWGDSISSHQAQMRLPTGIAMEWAAPNGIAGWYVSAFQASTFALANFANTLTETGSWPFVGFDHTAALTGAGFTVTDFNDSNLYSTSQVLTGVVSPLAKPCRKIVKSGVWNFPDLVSFWCGPQGICQHGTCWAAGDWFTGKTTIRVGAVHLANTLTVTDNMTIVTVEGDRNASAAAATAVAASLTPTAPVTPAIEVAWASIAATSIDTPFGTVQNTPGLSQNPLHFQYAGIGSTAPGTTQNATYLAAAGNADWTGAYRIRLSYNANATPASSKTTFIPYGMIVENTANTTGLYVDNISFSGDTIRTQLDGSTTAQMAATLNLHTGRPINWVLMPIGENHTTPQWNGGSINSALIRSDLLERIARVNAGWDTAGLPRGLITLVSPWESVGGTKSGSAWYTTVASIMREIARANDQISFIDLRQLMADRFTTGEMYNASRTNVYMNILTDGVHPSLMGERIIARLLWHSIMGGVSSTTEARGSNRSDRRGSRL